MTFLSGRTLN